MFKIYKTPSGTYKVFYADMLKQPHLMIAGATGSGKSVVINALIYTSLLKSPHDVQFIFIDPKRVELIAYSRLPHCVKYASEPKEMVAALKSAMNITESRYKDMQAHGEKTFKGAALYVIIDELADLMTTDKKHVQPLLQRLAQIGRAANVHLIVATQCPLSTVIPTAIKVNFDARVALRTRSAQDSRNILGVTGCENLPRYGKAYYMQPESTNLYDVPMYSDDDIEQRIDFWMHQKPKYRLFNRR